MHPPGQGKLGQYLRRLRREYVDQYSGKEGDVESQAIVAAYHTVKALTAFSRILDGQERYRGLIDQRIFLFNEGSRKAGCYSDWPTKSTPWYELMREFWRLGGLAPPGRRFRSAMAISMRRPGAFEQPSSQSPLRKLRYNRRASDHNR
jgi:hypothetical protein